MSKWSKSLIICLGDAAYAPTPLTGMSASLAILGAYVLAGKLSKVNDSEHPSKALEAYESTFRPFVEETQKIPSSFQLLGILNRYGRNGWLVQSFVQAFSKLAAMPWLANRSSQIKEDGSLLPQYVP